MRIANVHNFKSSISSVLPAVKAGVKVSLISSIANDRENHLGYRPKERRIPSFLRLFTARLYHAALSPLLLLSPG